MITTRQTTSRHMLDATTGAVLPVTAPSAPLYGPVWAEWSAFRDSATVAVETAETVTVDAVPFRSRPVRRTFSIAPTDTAAPIPARHVGPAVTVSCSADSDTPDDFVGAATLRICTVTRKSGKECGREYRAIWTDSGAVREFGCPKHGAESHAWRYSESAAVPAAMVEHLTWCALCDWTASRIVAADSGYRDDCPTHGADSTSGADLPRVIDNDLTAAATVERKYQDAGWIAPRPGADPEWCGLGRTRGTAFADSDRGESIKHGDERGRRGKQVRGESRGWIMASGTYRNRLTAPTPDASAVVVRSADGTPTAVLARNGRPLETVTESARRTLVARDARIAPVLDAQVSESAPERSRRARIAASAPRSTAPKSTVRADMSADAYAAW